MKSDSFPRIKGLDRQPNVVSQVVEHLGRLIADGLLAHGEKLPGEKVLARRLGISRPTMREAISVLKERGLVEIRPRSGTYVSSALASETLGAAEDLLAVDPTKLWDLLELRRVVDSGAARLAAERHTEEEIAELRTILDSVKGRGGPAVLLGREGGKAYREFFAVLARATRNTLYSHLVDTVSRMIRHSLQFVQWQLREDPAAALQVHRQLATILDAVEGGDGGLASALTDEHLVFVEQTMRGLVAP